MPNPIFVSRYAKPPAFDEQGKPIWPEHWRIKCGGCKKAVWRGNYHGINCSATHCKDCRKLPNDGLARHKPQKHPRAYTHIIRDRYDTTLLYKYSLLQGDIPKGYHIVYKANAGELLPPVYHDLDVYGETAETIE